MTVAGAGGGVLSKPSALTGADDDDDRMGAAPVSAGSAVRSSALAQADKQKKISEADETFFITLSGVKAARLSTVIVNNGQQQSERAEQQAADQQAAG